MSHSDAETTLSIYLAVIAFEAAADEEDAMDNAEIEGEVAGEDGDAIDAVGVVVVVVVVVATLVVAVPVVVAAAANAAPVAP